MYTISVRKVTSNRNTNWTLLVLLTRFAQITFSLGTFGTVIAITKIWDWQWYNSSNTPNPALTVPAAFCSGAAAAAGLMGLLVRPGKESNYELWRHQFILDCLTFVGVVAGEVCLAFAASRFNWDEKALWLVALCLNAASIASLLFSLVRTLVLWSKGALLKTLQRENSWKLKDTGSWDNSVDYGSRHLPPVNEMPEVYVTDQNPTTDDVKSYAPSRQVSDVGTTAHWSTVSRKTLAYPSTRSEAEAPARTPSVAAPSYYSNHMSPTKA